MTLIKEIEAALPHIAALPSEWQKDVALVLSRFVLAYDKTLTMTLEEARLERDREIAAALELAQRGAGVGPQAPGDRHPKGGNDSSGEPAS